MEENRRALKKLNEALVNKISEFTPEDLASRGAILSDIQEGLEALDKLLQNE